MPFGIGFSELAVLFLILLLLFGANRISGLGSSLGKAIRGFYDEVSGSGNHDEKHE